MANLMLRSDEKAGCRGKRLRMTNYIPYHGKKLDDDKDNNKNNLASAIHCAVSSQFAKPEIRARDHKRCYNTNQVDARGDSSDWFEHFF